METSEEGREGGRKGGKEKTSASIYQFPFGLLRPCILLELGVAAAVCNHDGIENRKHKITNAEKHSNNNNYTSNKPHTTTNYLLTTRNWKSCKQMKYKSTFTGWE